MLTKLEIVKSEFLLQMQSGYVLNFSDAYFSKVFRRLSINIDEPEYSADKPGASKANRVRDFWEQEDDALVSDVLL